MKALSYIMTDQSDFKDAEPAPLCKEEVKTELLKGLFTSERRKQYYVVGLNDTRRDSCKADDKERDDFFRFDKNNGEMIGIGNLAGIVHDTVLHNGKEYDVTLEIHSRFDTKNAWFLQTMFETTLKEEEWLLDDGIRVSDSFDSFENIFGHMLVWQFANMVQRAFSKGVYSTYLRQEENRDRLSDTLDIARHIRLNAGQNNGRVACQRRIRTTDNALNRLILCAWEQLQQKYQAFTDALISHNAAFDDSLKKIRREVSQTRFRAIECIAENLLPITGPYYTDYEDLRVLCLRILWEEGANCFAGDEIDEVKGILVYIPALWERYLEDHFRTHPVLSDLTAQTEYETKDVRELWEHLDYVLSDSFSDQQREDFQYALSRVKNISSIRPDFSILNDNKPFFILDAKHKAVKNLLDADGYLKLMRDQVICQLMFYLDPQKYKYLFEIIFKGNRLQKVFLPHGGLIFPITEKDKQQLSALSKAENQKSFPVVIPSQDEITYGKWKAEVETNMTDIMEQLAAAVQVAKSEQNEWLEWIRIGQDTIRRENTP